MKQIMENYTSIDKEVWKLLFERQKNNLQNKASTVYLECLQNMDSVLNADEIPNFEKINNWFEKKTGWKIEVVPGLIPVEEFFILLSQKKFCSSTWLRGIDNLDYLEEPDMFHDIFGHIPLLANPIFSSFVHAFGQLGVENLNNQNILIELQRLYWFTIEFGVIKEENIKSYGAGIISSFQEINHVHEVISNFQTFDLKDIIETNFKTDEIQEKYFLLSNFNELFDSIETYRNILENKLIQAL